MTHNTLDRRDDVNSGDDFDSRMLIRTSAAGAPRELIVGRCCRFVESRPSRLLLQYFSARIAPIYLLLIRDRQLDQSRIETVLALRQSTWPTARAPWLAFLQNRHRHRACSRTDAMCRDRPIEPNRTENTRWRVVCNSSQCTSHTKTHPQYHKLRQSMESARQVAAARAATLTARQSAYVADETVRSIASFSLHSLQSRLHRSEIRRSNRAVVQCVVEAPEGQSQLCVANCEPDTSFCTIRCLFHSFSLSISNSRIATATQPCFEPAVASLAIESSVPAT